MSMYPNKLVLVDIVTSCKTYMRIKTKTCSDSRRMEICNCMKSATQCLHGLITPKNHGDGDDITLPYNITKTSINWGNFIMENNPSVTI